MVKKFWEWVFYQIKPHTCDYMYVIHTFHWTFKFDSVLTPDLLDLYDTMMSLSFSSSSLSLL